MGKTAKGAVWLDPAKTSPYEFYQYWRNIDDADVMKCIRMLTFIPLSEIEEMEQWDDSRINEKKKILAHSLTALVHGEEEAQKAEATAMSLFTGGGDDANMPSFAVPEDALTDGTINIVDMLLLGGIDSSKGKVRTLITQGSIQMNGERVDDTWLSVTKEQLQDGVRIKKGKKTYVKFTL
jgi:tyrosyl-tRNA synthetase